MSKKRKAESNISSEVNDNNLDFESMTVNKLKELLRSRDLSTNGKKNVLIERISTRFKKEKDPDYHARPKKKQKNCEWCGDVMKKRNGRKGEFYGCASYPTCPFTTSLAGHARKGREHLRDLPALTANMPDSRLGWAILKQNVAHANERQEERKMDKILGL